MCDRGYVEESIMTQPEQPEQRELEQVFGFLALPALQPTALEVLLSVSTGEELIRVLRKEQNFVQALVSLYKRETAVKVLVNASRDEQVAELVWQCVNTQNNLKMVKDLLNTQFGRMLFCNLAKVPSCKAFLIEHHLDDIVGQLDNQHCQYIIIELSASMNMSVFEAVTKDCQDFELFASVTKNMLFNVDNHNLIIPVIDYQRLVSIKEPSVTVVEMLLLLCTTFEGRKRLRECNVYENLKHAHLQSVDDDYRELVERVVELLIRDEEQQ